MYIYAYLGTYLGRVIILGKVASNRFVDLKNARTNQAKIKSDTSGKYHDIGKGLKCLKYLE